MEVQRQGNGWLRGLDLGQRFGEGLHGVLLTLAIRCAAGWQVRVKRDRVEPTAGPAVSAPRATIIKPASGSGLCSAFASSHGARIHTSRSSSVVSITGIALAPIGSTVALPLHQEFGQAGDGVRDPPRFIGSQMLVVIIPSGSVHIVPAINGRQQYPVAVLTLKPS